MLQTSLNKNFYFVSLGCPKNRVDSEVMLGVLQKANYKVTTDPEQAGIIVINTCGFIDEAKKESIDTVLEMAGYKESGSCHTLAVTGCLVQRYAQEMQKSLPEVDLFIGTGEYHRIAEYLTAKRISPEAPIYLTEPTYIHTHDTPRILSERKPFAYLKVAEGCMKRCSFCIIPLMRGDLRSRSTADVVQEAWYLARQGVKEIGVIAQDLTDYGRDFRPPIKDALPNMLRELCKVEGIEWIRLFYCYPDGITPSLISVMKDEPKICSYLDMPLQHASDPVLKRMNRSITREKMEDKIQTLRQAIPNISIRTSLIVGFPGETEDDFQQLIDFVQWAKLDHVGAFAYSHEEGTPSYSLDQQVDQETKTRRHQTLLQVLENIALEKRTLAVGTTMKVLLEGPHPEWTDLLIGRHQGQAPDIDSKVLINDIEDRTLNPMVGHFYDVHITDTAGTDLTGTLIGPAKS